MYICIYVCNIHIYIYPAGPYFPRIWPQHQKKKYKGKKHSPEKQVGLVLSKIWPQHKRFARLRAWSAYLLGFSQARAREPSTQISFPKFDHRTKKTCAGVKFWKVRACRIYTSQSLKVPYELRTTRTLMLLFFTALPMLSQFHLQSSGLLWVVTVVIFPLVWLRERG